MLLPLSFLLPLTSAQPYPPLGPYRNYYVQFHDDTSKHGQYNNFFHTAVLDALPPLYLPYAGYTQSVGTSTDSCY